MLITRECDYAVRAVRALAEHEKKTVKEICDIEHIPHQYAYKILKKLEKAGIVASSRGVNGGYILLKDLNSFSLSDIFFAIENELFLNECQQAGYQCRHNQDKNPCKVHSELCRIQNELAKSLSEKTMAEVLSSED